MAHFTYLTPLIPNPDWQKFVMALAIGGGMIAIGATLAKKLKTPQGVDAAIIPTTSPSAFGLVDMAVEQWVRFQDSILGKENRRYAPFTCSVFFFMLIANLLGLIPGMPAATTVVWINVGMALVVFVYFNWIGIKENGVIGYIKHFAGPVWWLAWLIFPIEVFSTILRVLTLNLRLYWNISADHTVVQVFTGLVPFGIPVVFYILGTLVAVVQAFIFSVLTMVYIQLASPHHDDTH